MAALDSINTSVTGLEASAGQIVVSLNALAAKVSTGTVSQAEVDAIAARINGVKNGLDAANAAVAALAS